MKTNPSALTGAELWVRLEASENPKSIAARILPDSIGGVAARLAAELPDGSAQDKADWLLAFEEKFPFHFQPHLHRQDMSKLTASQKLAIANERSIPSHLKNRK